MRRGFFALVAAVVAGPVAADDRGAALFFGTGGTGVEVGLAGSEATLPARLFPCANCHGRDGAGGREGALAVPPLTGRDLAEDVLAAALEDGRGADGRTLDRAMPRYRLEPGDAGALAAFLLRLDAGERAGVLADRVRVAVIFAPERRPEAEEFLSGLVRSAGDARRWGRALEPRLVAAGDATAGTGLFVAAASFAPEGAVAGLPVMPGGGEDALRAGEVAGRAALEALHAAGRNVTRARFLDALGAGAAERPE